MKKTTGKKVYGVAAIDQKEYGKAAGEKVPVAVSQQSMTERASDPLDELFE